MDFQTGSAAADTTLGIEQLISDMKSAIIDTLTFSEVERFMLFHF